MVDRMALKKEWSSVELMAAKMVEMKVGRLVPWMECLMVDEMGSGKGA